MGRLIFEFLVLLPLAVVTALYVLYRMGVLRPQKSKEVRELENQREVNRLLDELTQDPPPPRSRVRLRRPDQRK